MGKPNNIARMSAVLFLAGAVQVIVATGPANAQATNTDAQITQKVQAALTSNHSLHVDNIDVQTHDGIVHLRGVVDTRLEREDAQALAAAIPGVKSVMNDLVSNKGN